MTHPDHYKTILKPSEGDFRERGSKFLSYAFHAESEADIKHEIERLKKLHPTARHFCYGAVLGSERTEERSNDAGEPNGTAGLPILNQILSAELKNVAVVVVRHFGGTKLGKPGLIAAYKLSTQLVLEEAEVVSLFNTSKIKFAFEYPATGPVMQAIEQMPHSKIEEQIFLESCTIVVSVPKSEVDKALHLFDHTNEVNVSHIQD
jgi:uncharacterized YigZ family protein